MFTRRHGVNKAIEIKLLSAAVQDRETFDQLEKYNIASDLSDQGQILWNSIKQYYNKDTSSTSVDRELLKNSISREVPKHESMFHQLIDNMSDVSIPNLLHEVIEQKRERNSLELTQALTANKDERVSELWSEREMLISGDLEASNTTQVVIAPDLTEVFKARSRENRLGVTPPQLDEALEGGFLRGHHCVLFAVTDLGKTLFSLDLARNFIMNGYKVLYVCNEDPLSDLLERFLVSLTGRDKWAVRRHPDKAQALAEKMGWRNMVWAELAPGTLGEIQSLIEDHKPDVLFVDQLRNLDVGENNFVRTLEKAAQGVRNFCKAYNLVAISITQAGDSADGKAVLGRGDIDNSNVGIPGTADLMLGIGATQEQEFNGVRTFSFPKNKVSGNKQPVLATFNTKIMRAE